MAVTGFVGRGILLEFLTSVTSGAATSAPTINVPAAVQEGDLLVLCDVGVSSNAAVTETIPDGFTSAVSSTIEFVIGPNTFRDRAIISFKIADGDDASSTLTGLNGNAQENKILLVFRADRVLGSASAGSTNNEATQGDPSAQTITVQNGALVALALYIEHGSPPAVDPRTFTIGGNDAKDDEIQVTAGNIDMWSAYKIFSRGVSKQNVTVDMEDEAHSIANLLLSCTISVST